MVKVVNLLTSGSEVFLVELSTEPEDSIPCEITLLLLG